MKNSSILLGLFLLFSFQFTLIAQTAKEKTVSLTFRNEPLSKAFKQIEKASGYKILFTSDDIKSLTTTCTIKNASVLEAVKQVIGRHPLDYTVKNEFITVIRRDAHAQTEQKRVASGIVTDADLQPLAGVTVMSIDSKTGVVTDKNGRFSLELPVGVKHLQISCVGMKTQVVDVSGSPLTIVMTEDVAEFDEVVVTGYQNIAREKSTGAITTVSAEKLSDRYTINLKDNLEGRVAGLTVYDGKMTIRGAGSLYAETSPLLVVDGLPIEGSIDDVNPYDVESVTVLKDASATAIYGARASNGIIVIKTKRASQRDRIDVNVSANFTVYQKRDLDYAHNFYMTPEQQVNAEMDYYQYYFNTPSEIPDPIGETEFQIYGSGNWTPYLTPVHYAYYQMAKGEISQSELSQRMNVLKQNNFAREYADKVLLNRILQQYNVAIRSRSESFQSNLVINYKHDNTGIIKASDDNISIWYKGSYDMAKWLTFNFSVNNIFVRTEGSNSAYATDPFNVPAYYRLTDDNGDYAWYSTAEYNIYNTLPEENTALRSMKFNHLAELSYDRKTSSRRNSRLHGEMLLKIIPELTVNTQFVYESERNTEKSYSEAESYIMRWMRNLYTNQQGDAYTYLIPENGGKLATLNTQGEHWTVRGQANFDKSFSKHAVSLIAGLEFRQTLTNGTRGLLLGYDDQLQSDATSTVNFQALSQQYMTSFFAPGSYVRDLMYDVYIRPFMGTVAEQRHRYASGYVNMTYTYNERYNLFGSFRKDYADVYGLNAKFRGKPLWSIGASWNIFKEDFLKELNHFNLLQIRSSYGITGNIYQGSTSRMTANSSGYNEVTNLPMSTIESPANPELKWEETATTNIGLDFRLLDHRLRGAFDWYHKNGYNIFSYKTLDPTNGFTGLVMNMASVKNDGLELSLAYEWLRPQNDMGFGWNMQLVVSHNNNKITRVESQATRAYQLIDSPYKEGYPVHALFSYQFAGIDDTGTPTWYSSDGQPVTIPKIADVDVLVYSGQSDPVNVISLDNQLKYRNFSLNLLMAYYGGHKMRVRQAYALFNDNMPAVLPNYFLNAWTPDNKDTDVPGFGRYAPASILADQTENTDIYIQPADFIKIRNVVLGYDLPKLLLSKIGLNSASLRFQLDNPKYLWVKNKVDIDPETRSLRMPSSCIFGLNINL
ncbi:MAG: SusC/RagA family TonB-linked outer membrane protein [Dysgonamonadaceae bacterium]|jgi:TonB-linked SusC/RagA family outer membrane protein|nr:SusC/RagA family TonB-linked outer membrane protein [Dysgonamonadaceae bacterium]